MPVSTMGGSGIPACSNVCTNIPRQPNAEPMNLGGMNERPSRLPLTDLEDELRTAFALEAAGTEPAPDAWAQVLDRSARARYQSRPPQIAVGIAALLIIVVGMVLVLGDGENGESNVPTTERTKHVGGLPALRLTVASATAQATSDGSFKLTTSGAGCSAGAQVLVVLSEEVPPITTHAKGTGHWEATAELTALYSSTSLRVECDGQQVTTGITISGEAS